MKFGWLFILSVYMLSMVSVAHAISTRGNYTSGTVYDCISRRNVPVYKLTDDEAKSIILSCQRWNRDKLTPELQAELSKKSTKSEVKRTKTGKRYTTGRSNYARTAATVPQAIGTGNAKYYTTRQIATAFGIDMIYDPIKKRFVDYKSLSRRRLIEYLNNPVSQEFTFENVEEVQERLVELNLKDNYVYSLREKAQPKSVDILERRAERNKGETVIIKRFGYSFTKEQTE